MIPSIQLALFIRNDSGHVALRGAPGEFHHPGLGLGLGLRFRVTVSVRVMVRVRDMGRVRDWGGEILRERRFTPRPIRVPQF